MASATRDARAAVLTLLADDGDDGPASYLIYKLKMTIFNIKKKTFPWEAFLKVAKILANVN